MLRTNYESVILYWFAPSFDRHSMCRLGRGRRRRPVKRLGRPVATRLACPSPGRQQTLQIALNWARARRCDTGKIWRRPCPSQTSYRYLDASPWHLGRPRPARVPMAATPAHPGHLKARGLLGLQYGHGIAGGAQRALAGIIPKHRCWAAMKSTLTE